MKVNIKDPLISVIVPVYNAMDTLSECIESVLMQTYKNIEIILVDDGSSDESPEICDDYNNRYNNIRVIHKQNGGASSARNCGIKYSLGDYVGFVDSDDTISEKMYELLYALITSYNVEVAACNIWPGTKRREENCQTGILKNKDLWSYFYRINGERSNYSVLNKLFKRSVVEKVSFAEGKTTEDLLYNYEVLKKVQCMAITGMQLYFARRVFGSVTNQSLKMLDLSLIEIWDYIFNEEKGGEYAEYALFNRRRAEFTLYVKGLRYGYEKNMYSFMQEWKQNIKKFYPELRKSNVLDFKRRILLEYIRLF